MTEPTVQIRIGEQWVDVSERARRAAPPRVRRGRADEASKVTATTAVVRLRNTDAALTPGNPLSEWYPGFDLGTLLRLRVPGDETHLHMSGLIASGAQTPDHPSLDIVGDFHLRVTQTLAGVPAQGVTLAAKDGGDGQRSWYFYLAPSGLLELVWSPDGTYASSEAPESLVPVQIPSNGRIGFGVKLDVSNAGNHVITYETAVGGTWVDLSTETRPGTTAIFASTAPLRVRSYLYGARFHSLQLRNGILGTEVANPDIAAQTPGDRSFVDAAGRTWTLTGDAEITNERVRFVGEITSLELDWPHASAPDDPLDEGVSHMRVEATGVLKRMAQGEKALRSPLHRWVTGAQNLPSVLAYWPFEDGDAATSVASPIEGVQPLTFGGDLRLGSDSTHPGSAPLPEVSAGQPFGWYGRIPPPVGTITNWAFDGYFRVPTRETSPASTVLSFIDSSGTAHQWRLALSDTGFRLTAYNSVGDEIENSLFSSSGWGDDWMLLHFRVSQQLSAVEWEVSFGTLGGSFGGTSGSFSGVAGHPTAIRALATAPPDGLAVGHFVVSTGLELGWLGPADRGWPDEPAGERLMRLCDEEGVVLTVVGDPTETSRMDIQTVASLMDLIDESAEADMGILHEQRETIGLRYRTRASMYNQVPALELDTATKDLSRVFAPVSNDQRTRNDVTVERPGGSSARVVGEASINGTETIPGRGLYDEKVSVGLSNDDLLAYHAGWRLHLGTWRGLRLPTLSTQMNRVPGLIPAWLDVDLGDRITATNLPRQYPGDADQLVEQYEESWDPPLWPVDLTVSPAEPWDVGVLDDEERGRADTAGSTIAGGAADNSTTTSTSHVAPSAYAPSANCLLIAAWQSFDNNGNYTLPGSMTAGPAETDGANFSTLRTGYQQLSASGATGTRTATLSVSDRWSAVAALARGASGNPVIEETQSAVGDNASVTLTTADDTEAGWWLVAIHGWDLDRDGRMPAFAGWTLLADSGQSPPVTPSASRTRVWVRKVPHAGPHAVVFPVLDDAAENNDNHAHLYVLSNVSDIFVTAADTTLPVATPFGPLWITTAAFPTQFPFDISLGGSAFGERAERCTVTAITGTESPQTFTVTRAVNGLELDHPVGADVRLWTPMRAAY